MLFWEEFLLELLLDVRSSGIVLHVSYFFLCNPSVVFGDFLSSIFRSINLLFSWVPSSILHTYLALIFNNSLLLKNNSLYLFHNSCLYRQIPLLLLKGTKSFLESSVFSTFSSLTYSFVEFVVPLLWCLHSPDFGNLWLCTHLPVCEGPPGMEDSSQQL